MKIKELLYKIKDIKLRCVGIYYRIKNISFMFIMRCFYYGILLWLVLVLMAVTLNLLGNEQLLSITQFIIQLVMNELEYLIKCYQLFERWDDLITRHLDFLDRFEGYGFHNQYVTGKGGIPDGLGIRPLKRSKDAMKLLTTRSIEASLVYELLLILSEYSKLMADYMVLIDGKLWYILLLDVCVLFNIVMFPCFVIIEVCRLFYKFYKYCMDLKEWRYCYLRVLYLRYVKLRKRHNARLRKKYLEKLMKVYAYLKDLLCGVYDLYLRNVVRKFLTFLGSKYQSIFGAYSLKVKRSTHNGNSKGSSPFRPNIDEKEKNKR